MVGFNAIKVFLLERLCVLAILAVWFPAFCWSRCPDNYCYRVETCILEAQVAPQAGGGLNLITDRNRLEELCERGLLQKTIDCLQDIQLRCGNNATRKQELDMLFSVGDWKYGQQLLCEDLNHKMAFMDHFQCMSSFGPRISSCILIRTQMFKKDVTNVRVSRSRTLHDITCNFAQNIVNCLEYPLARSCNQEVVNTLVSALHRFLPPACSPLPTVHSSKTELGQSDLEVDQQTPEIVTSEGTEAEH